MLTLNDKHYNDLIDILHEDGFEIDDNSCYDYMITVQDFIDEITAAKDCGEFENYDFDDDLEFISRFSKDCYVVKIIGKFYEFSISVLDKDFKFLESQYKK